MSEEEIIEILKKLISWKGMKVEIRDYEIEAIQGLLDLYKKEKSLNKVLKSKTFKDICYNIGEFDNRFISKDKIKNKIKELEVMLRTYIENSKNDIYYNSEYVNSIEMSIKILKELLKEV